MGADGFIELKPEHFKTSEGVAEINRMLKFLHDAISGDGVSQKVYNGVGSPEGVVVAQPGSIYMNLSGGAGTSVYVKETGSGSSGWVAK